LTIHHCGLLVVYSIHYVPPLTSSKRPCTQDEVGAKVKEVLELKDHCDIV